MMVSFIQSNYMGFGSGVVINGISMQNRGATFVMTSGHPNRSARASALTRRSSLLSSRKNGQPVMSFGVMGAACSRKVTPR